MSAHRITPHTIGQLRERGRVQVGYITQLAWSPDGAALAIAHGGGVSLWQGGFGGSPSLTLEHAAPVKGIAFSPDSKVLATGSADMQVRLWLMASGRSLFVMRGHTDRVNAVAISPDGRLIVSGGADRALRLVDLMDSRGLNPLNGHTDAVTSVAFTPDSRTIVSASADATIQLWNITTPDSTFTHRYDDGVRAFAVSRDGASLAAGLANGDLIVSGLGLTFEHWRKLAHEGGVDTVAYAPDGTLIVTGGRDFTAKLWDSATGDLLATVEGHTKPILTAAFNPPGTMLVTGSGDNTAVLWMVDA